MFAVLKTGGKQYRVQAGDVLRIELVAAATGDKIQFNEVLMIGGDAPVLGAPLVAGAAVQAEVIEEKIKADKVITYHKRRRKHSSQRTRGHRQKLTLVRVTDILASGGDRSGVKAAIGVHAARVAAHGSKDEAPVAVEKPKRAAKKAADPVAAPAAAQE
jgi:large subunit ribosomal protein L21